MPKIHPTAIVDTRALLAEDVEIGPYVIIAGAVTIGAGTVIHAATHIDGPTKIGSHCRIGPAAFVGLDPQHLHFKIDNANPTYALIGDGVTIREGASVHRATRAGLEHATRVGDRAFIMGGAHVAHDCVIGSEAILANGVLIGGHVQVGSNAFLGGGSVYHQFVRIGRLAVVGGNEAIAKDIPPFGAAWDRRLKGYNAVGCRRAGLSRPAIASIRATYQRLHSHRSTNAAVEAINAEVELTPEVAEILGFIGTTSRGIQPSRGDDSPGTGPE